MALADTASATTEPAAGEEDPPLRTDLRAVWQLVREAADAWVEDRAATMGAALAYYTVFSVAPLLLIVISVAGLVFGAEAARGEIFGELRGMMGAEAALAVQGLLDSVKQPEQSMLATVIGFGRAAGRRDHRVRRAAGRRSTTSGARRRATTRSGAWALLRARLLSFGMILGIGFLLMVSLVSARRWPRSASGGGRCSAAGRCSPASSTSCVGFALTTAVFAMIYKIMPRVKVDWRDVLVGASVTSLLFTIGKSLIGLYIGKSSVASGFGAAGSLVVVLVWVYYSAQIFLFGAEFTWAYAHSFGSRRNIDRNAPVAPVEPDEPAAATTAPQGLAARAASTMAAVAAATAAVAVAEKSQPPPD